MYQILLLITHFRKLKTRTKTQNNSKQSNCMWLPTHQNNRHTLAWNIHKTRKAPRQLLTHEVRKEEGKKERK